MSRYYGKIGFEKLVETRPGIWESPEIIERPYYGDVIRMANRWESRNDLNDDLKFNNEISIVADSFAYENFTYMKYIEFMGQLFNITNVEISYPRITISIGGVYHG